jgi:hypothetical protein
MGMPWPSTSRLRLTPRLARSVGFFPVFFPPEGRLGHAPVQAQPGPVDLLQVVVFVQAGAPHLQEDAGLDPLLEAVMGRGAGAEAGGVEGLPRAAGAQVEEDGIHTNPIRGAWLAAAEGVCVHVFWEEPFDFLPEVIGDAPGFGALQGVHGEVSRWVVRGTRSKGSCIQPL